MPTNKQIAAMRRATRSDNKLGVKGVWVERGSFRARITVRGRSIELGRHETLEQAKEAYAEAARKHFGIHANPDGAPVPRLKYPPAAPNTGLLKALQEIYAIANLYLSDADLIP